MPSVDQFLADVTETEFTVRFYKQKGYLWSAFCEMTKTYGSGETIQAALDDLLTKLAMKQIEAARDAHNARVEIRKGE